MFLFLVLKVLLPTSNSLVASEVYEMYTFEHPNSTELTTLMPGTSLKATHSIPPITWSSRRVEWTAFNGSLYHVHAKPLNWFHSLFWCFKHHSRFVSILSPEENAFINDLTESEIRQPSGKSKSVWIGAYYKEGKKGFVWTDSSPWNFPNSVIGSSNVNLDRQCLKFESKQNKNRVQADIATSTAHSGGVSIKPWVVEALDEIHLGVIEGYKNEIEQFVETAGLLFYVSIRDFTSKSVSFDLLFDSFVPIDGGFFIFEGKASRHQLERLPMKCDMSETAVRFEVCFVNFDGERALGNMFNLSKYSQTRLEKDWLVAYREESELELHIRDHDRLLECGWVRVKRVTVNAS
ncbi:hypothetical protein QR680_018622 [Steinernema hermaphroditum]|uniref:C-type lectin domain-containing protein n=1 Tax=Steinernema hermaphroditum TaxID=289476 RepID=A0AA39LRE0_9BILA|nr:hypothetical protein QR680_018622 [Steinernema hermaphroditum]